MSDSREGHDGGAAHGKYLLQRPGSKAEGVALRQDNPQARWEDATTFTLEV